MALWDDSFSVPEVELSGGRVWAARQAVEKWAKATGRTIVEKEW
jgi:hypothetical protein